VPLGAQSTQSVNCIFEPKQYESMKIDIKGGPCSRVIKKTALIMRITVFLLLAGLFQAKADGSYAQQVTLRMKNATVQKVFREIEKQTGYTFWYRSDLSSRKEGVTLRVNDMQLNQVLQLICADQQLTYSIVEKVIVVKNDITPPDDGRIAAPEPLKTAWLKFDGVVLSADSKQPLSGATVAVKGKNDKTVLSDDKGNFSIDAEKGDVLVVTYIGYQTREIVLNETGRLITIELSPSVMELEAVTVSTGYQTISKERTSGSYSKASIEIMNDRSVSMNILDRIDGLVPGLTVNRAPNATANPFLIRGLTSINSNRAPLVVVDGIPGIDINTVNPQDVDDITVLRDAVAASVWGSRAANGVIVITTKKGVVSDKMKVRYDAFVSLQGTPNLDYLPGLNSQEFIQAARDVFNPVNYPYANAFGYVNLGSTGVPPHERFQYFHALGRITTDQLNKSLDSLGSIDNRQQVRDLWFRNALLQNHTLSLSGGSKAYSFYGSLAYTNNQSFRPGETNQQFKVNLRQDLTVNKWLSAFVITDLTNTNQTTKNSIDIF
jgi:TonB-dependent SusC/RagA subfamily outer membrane receptor